MKTFFRAHSNLVLAGMRPATRSPEVLMSFRSLFTRASLALGLAALCALPALAAGAGGRKAPPAPPAAPVQSQPAELTGSATINFAELALLEAYGRKVALPARPRHLQEEEERELNENGLEPGAGMIGAPALPLARIPVQPNVASPAPVQGFQGLDDIAMVDSSYIIIPPDVGGAVGPTKIMSSHNNNYRIFDKATGAVLSTVGTATFWAPVVAVAERASLTDPRTMYDPYNNRWITCMQTVTSGAGKLLIGVSQTSDPSGAWFLYSFNSANTVDFPNLGFNKNWIAMAINRYSAAGAFQRGIILAVNYPSALAGTGTGTIFTAAAGTGFCAAPCITYSATQESLFVVTHLSSASATYQVGAITGTAAAPVYTASLSGTLTRPGGGWVQPTGNQQPQAAPLAGASACGATPCTIESQDSQLRSAPVWRPSATDAGHIYYAQTVNLPSGTFTHTGVQWTKLRTGAGIGAFVDGGRIEDPTATATNGGKFYGNASIAVNSLGDILLGFTQFSSAQYPAAGYAYHDHTDAAGTMRDPIVAKAGEDYYHKTFSTATGRNRWGDYSTVQVDPTDDLAIWSLQEYAKTRTGTDDGNTGANSSRWSTWWAKMSPGTFFTITASAGAGGSISPNGGVSVALGANQSFTITPAACFSIADVVVDGVSQGPINNFTFTNVTANHTIAATFTQNTFAITASAGANGTISPSGTVNVNCGANQTFTFTPAACFHVADVVVDGNSQGAVSAFSFTNVQAAHTISVTFAPNAPSTITLTAGANGSVSPSGPALVNCGDNLTVSITPDACYHIANVFVDGVPQGPITAYTFTNVTANHTLSATFAIDTYTITASSSANGNIAPSGANTVNCGSNASFTMTPSTGFYLSDLVVDGGSVPASTLYTFTNVTANHTIAAVFSPDTSRVSVGSSSVILSPLHPTVTLPVLVHRLTNQPVLGFSVRIQLSPGVTLNSAAIGPFLGNVGATLFNTIDLGGGLYSFDGALTQNCGATATDDTLFTLVLSSTATSGTGTASVGTSRLRDCQNAALAIVAGNAGSFTIDREGPALTLDFPVGGEGFTIGFTQTFHWTTSDPNAVSSVGLELSRTGAAGPFDPLATLNAGVDALDHFDWLATPPPTGTAFLRVTASDSLGNSTTVQNASPFFIQHTSGVDGGPVTDFALSPVVPNPSRGLERVTFALPREAHVHLGVVDLQGREVLSIADGVYGAGRHTAQANGKVALSPGLYFVRMSVPGRTITTRFLMMK